ncbi:MAG: hypothetical protein Q8P31_00435 [Bacillota bacterium]|nr:hypothetical protein [Bacillota bacterium]
MSRPVRVVLGAVQFGDEPSLTPMVCLECADAAQAADLAAFLLSVQTGEQTMARQDAAFHTGDIAIKIEVARHPTRPKEAVLASARVRSDPGHLTEALYACSAVTADAAQVFRFFQQALRHFVVTVSVNEQPLCDLLYLIKYILTWTSPVESSPP